RTDLVAGIVGSDDDRAVVSEQELAAEEDAQVATVSAASVGNATVVSESELFDSEQKLLDEMTELAESSRALPDARVTKLVEWMKAEMCPELGAADAKWNNLRVIIFTEYEDTQRYLRQQLSAAISGSDRADERIAIFHGPTP